MLREEAGQAGKRTTTQDVTAHSQSARNCRFLMIVLMIMTMMIIIQAMHGDRMGPPQALLHISFHTALSS